MEVDLAYIFVITLVIGTSAVLLIVSEVVQFSQTGGDDRFHWSCTGS